MNNNSTPNSYEDVHTTSQKHKRKLKEYKINPLLIPRPNTFNEFFHNEQKQPIYCTNIDSIPPFSYTFYKVIENDNSSCRFIRSSLTKIPTKQSILKSSGLFFGLYFCPFAEQLHDEEAKLLHQDIYTYNYNTKIYRCTKCNAYMNSKWKLSYNKQNKQVIICNICQNANEVTSINMVNVLGELNLPTITYTLHKEQDDVDRKGVYYIMFIDVTSHAIESGFSEYVVNSIRNSIDGFYNKQNSYVSINVYDDNCIWFLYIEKNEVKCIKVTDTTSPFVPLYKTQLYFNLSDETSYNDIISKLIDKINIIISLNSTRKPKTHTSLAYSAITTGIHSLKQVSQGRIIIFEYSPCYKGYTSSLINDTSLINDLNASNIVIDQFVVVNTSLNGSYELNKDKYDLYITALSRLSQETGGNYNIYEVNNNKHSNPSHVNAVYEKIYYDYYNIISYNNYYDVKFMIRYSNSVDCYEILGSFNKKVGEAFQIAGCDNKNAFCYAFRLNQNSKELNVNEEVHFQIAMLYYDTNSCENMRIFNYTVKATDSVEKIFSSCDVDTISRITIMKEVSNMLTEHDHVITQTNDTKDNTTNTNTTINNDDKCYNTLYKRILTSFKYYRIESASDKDPSQLILPSSLKYFPIYLYSFLHTRKFYLIRHNHIMLLYLYFRFMKSPLDHIMKLLYPQMYRIDDIQFDQLYNSVNIVDKSLIIHDIGKLNTKYNIIQKPYMLRLSLDSIDFDSAYMINDGEYITVLIFDKIGYDFYNEVFSVATWSDCVDKGIYEIDSSNKSDINERILNIIEQLHNENNGQLQPVKLHFLSERSNIKSYYTLNKYLLEDALPQGSSYVDFLCGLHQDIQRDIY